MCTTYQIIIAFEIHFQICIIFSLLLITVIHMLVPHRQVKYSVPVKITLSLFGILSFDNHFVKPQWGKIGPSSL